ncbi:glycosyltransferase family 1 protein [Rhizoctonia solani]|uniref:Glycosyltransferase family 1 protein n=1 Tax=Rhizoctonia solani TaxID=456999 RepID=A0A8H8T309_9AGAM|nr:glycosyltransferase family 1 protein [Rhizoctonia solani]QRW26844.1 glycosyltransferase family 1 protein [Rhizoctonia solani]
MDKDDMPYHMREESGKNVVPDTFDKQSSRRSGDTTKVEIGSIKTHPGINYASYKALGKGLSSSANMTPDGRIVITLDLHKKLPDLPKDYANPVREYAVDRVDWRIAPPMSIVIMIVGSRGDVQPFLALGKKLKEYGHDIRIATHGTFKSFVKGSGLRFFDIGGDPEQLMSYMVRNPGLMPGLESLTNGDIGMKRKMVAEYLDGCWKACYQPDDDDDQLSFAADAIISNPPAFAHIHCAEALGIPLQLSFTMPWCATTDFPHPLVNVLQSNAGMGLTNVLSYALAELMTWQGLGDVINHFRTQTLGLEPLSLRSGAGLVDRIRVPWTYCMSPALVPKPDDWTNHIDVVGFYFLDLASNYEPPDNVKKFLNEGEPPIYIGFGSIVIEEPKEMTQKIFQAIKETRTRAILSAGWGGLFAPDSPNVPEGVLILDKQTGNIPHDWLFNYVSAVCHHGGAGTTSAGLKAGKPTIVVPFFGDQPFWGTMIARAGAGPEPIPQDELSTKKLIAAFEFVKSPRAKQAAERMGKQIRSENGVMLGADSFHKHLPLLNMRCDIDPHKLAEWWSPEHYLRLSGFAATTLTEAGLLDTKKIQRHRTKEYETHKKATDPITGGSIEIMRTVTHYYAGIAQIFYSPIKGIINTTTAIPKGIMNIIGSVSDGFHNVPRIYGSEIRERGPITDFSSGITEGAKGLFYGYKDGITGLVTEPLAGAKKEGFIGFIKGSGRSYINATMKPAAGIMGMISNPIEGVWKSGQKRWAKQQDSQQLAIRVERGKRAYEASTEEERQDVIDAFKRLTKRNVTLDRKKTMEAEAKEMLQTDASRKLTLADDQDASDEEMSPSDDSKSVLRPVRSASPDRFAHSEVEKAAPPPPPKRPPQQNTQDEEAAFQRDLDLALRLSLAEQQGYERGLQAAAEAKQQK